MNTLGEMSFCFISFSFLHLIWTEDLFVMWIPHFEDLDFPSDEYLKNEPHACNKELEEKKKPRKPEGQDNGVRRE